MDDIEDVPHMAEAEDNVSIDQGLPLPHTASHLWQKQFGN
ncbi:MAG: hypothetical protein DHS20C20_29440 [Ardenticatenaceae bacterium]|nr:MAG: hypothetical protein DHS20C20_29440 [Ardenticatenaceae bacterium]